MTDVSTLGSEIQAVAKEPALDVRSRPQRFKGSRGAGQRRELMVHLRQSYKYVWTILGCKLLGHRLTQIGVLAQNMALCMVIPLGIGWLKSQTLGSLIQVAATHDAFWSWQTSHK